MAAKPQPHHIERIHVSMTWRTNTTLLTTLPLHLAFHPIPQATTTEETDKATCGKWGCADDNGNVAGPYGSASGRKLEVR